MVVWSHEKDQLLLVYFYEIAKGKGTIDWEEVAQQIGDDCTASGVKQHVQKMKSRTGVKAGSAVAQTPTRSTRSRKANVDTDASPSAVKRGRGRTRKVVKEDSSPVEPSSPVADEEPAVSTDV